MIYTPNDNNYRTISNKAGKTVSSLDYKLKIYHMINNVTMASHPADLKRHFDLTRHFSNIKNALPYIYRLLTSPGVMVLKL